ncbi:MAG: phosphate ABC transporter substrate-binding protein PstS [Pseudomonadota bacterium]
MKKITPFLTALCAVLTLVCGNARAGDKDLIGAGATFPYPYYAKLFDTYSQEKGIKVNYQSIGSGGGVQQLKQKTVDFGGTDGFMDDKDIQEAGAAILHVPTCLGAVVLSYNIAGNPALKLSFDLIVDIFLGKIEKWNDKRIAEINPGVKLPDTNIVTVHRSDGSGTTSIFSDYLSKVSAEWKERVGAGKSLNWPNGLGGKGNAGVAGLIQQMPGSIGYIELIYANQNKMAYADIKNKAGNFIKPSLASVSLSADVAIPDDTRVSITNTAAKDGYPISGFTWLVLYKEQNYSGRSQEKVDNLLKLLWWITHEGQKLAEPLDYAPLCKETVKKAEVILKSATYNGAQIIK